MMSSSEYTNNDEENTAVNAAKKSKMPEDSLSIFDRLGMWLRVFWGAITIEPAYFLYTMGLGLYAIASQEIYIEKTCR